MENPITEDQDETGETGETGQEKNNNNKKHSLLDILLLDDEEPEQPVFRFIRRTVRVAIGAVQKFISDEGILRAASISYSVIVSFVPTLIVVLLVGDRIFNFGQYKIIIKEFIRKNELPFQPEPYFEVFDQLLLNADKVTGVALLVIFFSATAVLRNMEQALNRVWQVRKNRPFMQKISGFLFVLILGPALMAVGLSTGRSYVRKAAPPDIRQIIFNNGEPTVLGSQGLFLRHSDGQWISGYNIETIDFSAQKDPILINEEDNRVLSKREVESVRAVLAKIKKTEQADLMSDTIEDIVVRGGKTWMVSSNGNLLFSKDNGKYWSIRRFEKEKMKLLFPLQFSRIRMVSDKEGFILGKSGLILNTKDGGENWQPAFVQKVHSNFNDVIKVSGNSYIAVGDSFTVMVSNDGGRKWSKLSNIDALKSKHGENLNDIAIHENHVWIAGDMGLILYSPDAGKTWQRHATGLDNIDFRTIAFENENSGIVAGENGFIRKTEDGGITWLQVEIDFPKAINHATYDKKQNKLWMAGEGYFLFSSPANNVSELEVILQPALWRSMFTALGEMILPFFAIWVVFFLIYKVMPYTDVSNAASAVGAMVTSLLWVTFLMVYKSYAGLFTKGTLAIYGTLAAIPVTLIIVYISAAIIMFGAEVGFFIQYPETLRLKHKKAQLETEKRQIWYAFRFLQVLYTNYHKGKGPTRESALLRACNNDTDDFKLIMNKFEELELIQKTEDSRYVPAKSADMVYLKDLIEVVDPTDYRVPATGTKDKFYEDLKDYFVKLRSLRREVFEEVTIADLMQNKSGVKPEA